jgi:hypothetical protein
VPLNPYRDVVALTGLGLFFLLIYDMPAWFEKKDFLQSMCCFIEKTSPSRVVEV